VDTGATHTLMPRDLLERLGVQPIGTKRFAIAEGRTLEYEVGQLLLRIDGEQWPTLCVFGNNNAQPLLGAMTLEAFLLTVDPVQRRLVPVDGTLS